MNSATNDFDTTPDRNPTVQEVNGSKGEAGALAPSESNRKPAIDSTRFDLNAEKSDVQYDPCKIFIPSNIPIQPASIAANAHVSQPAMLLLRSEITETGPRQVFWRPLKFSHIVSGFVNVLTQFWYECDLTSESVWNSAVRKLPGDLKAKWLTYLQRYDPGSKTMRVLALG